MQLVGYGAGLDHILVWRCVQLCYYCEHGWIVDGEHRPPTDPDHVDRRRTMGVHRRRARRSEHERSERASRTEAVSST